MSYSNKENSSITFFQNYRPVNIDVSLRIARIRARRQAISAAQLELNQQIDEFLSQQKNETLLPLTFSLKR